MAAAHRELVEKATAELGAREGAPEEVKKAAILLLRAGHRLNELMPKIREHLNVAGLGLDKHNTPDVLDKAWDVAGALKALSGSIPLPRPIGHILGQNTRDRVRRDLFNVTA